LERFFVFYWARQTKKENKNVMNSYIASGAKYSRSQELTTAFYEQPTEPAMPHTLGVVEAAQNDFVDWADMFLKLCETGDITPDQIRAVGACCMHEELDDYAQTA
jgi:hypothetical protein